MHSSCVENVPQLSRAQRRFKLRSAEVKKRRKTLSGPCTGIARQANETVGMYFITPRVANLCYSGLQTLRSQGELFQALFTADI